MPSSGYGSVDIFQKIKPTPKMPAKWIVDRVKVAMEHGLFIEWLESFLAAWEQTKDPFIASWAGLDEWDM